MVLGNALRRPATVIAAACFAICSAGAFCQQSTGTGSSSANSQSQSKPATEKKTTNAFPMAQSEAAAKAAQQDQPSAPQPNAQKSGKSSAAQDNPFPEAQSNAAAKADNSAHTQGAVSSSSSGYSSSDAHLPAPALGQGNLTSHSRLDSYTRDHTQDGRIEDDLKVADLYMKNGNYRGALLRYQDTLQYDPENDTALYGVAEAMCKENRTAEAMAQFKGYAKNNPQGKYAIKAEKMLAHPNKCMHNF